MPIRCFDTNLLRLIVFCILILPTLQKTTWQELHDDKELTRFLGKLEPFATTANDVVLILDESHSIGSDVYPQVLVFAELITRHFSVSSDDTRIALITFGTKPRTRIDYIREPYRKNMCTFIRDLKLIDDYAASYTHTGDAMIVARNMMKDGRTGINKIIILLTDGRSNGGYDLPTISKELKSSGVIIFAVGVAEVNVNELLDVATSEDHIYILKNFNLIFSLNDHLVNDTAESKYDKVSDTSLCNSYCSHHADCCDIHADCYCGTKTGKYECSCTAGFGGKSGHKGQCSSCAIGTYKTKVGNSDCVLCPANSTTLKVGSTSIQECVCILGHRGNPGSGSPCKPVECNALKAPEGGILVPRDCGNTYGSECTFKCNVGYCPYSCNKEDFNRKDGSLPWHILPSTPRVCLESGTWSGEDFFCEKVTCPLLEYPEGGYHNCSSELTGFSHGTVCDVTCNEGFTASGSRYRTCLTNGSWTGIQTVCTAIQCPPLKTNYDLYIKPKTCLSNSMKFQSTCFYYCKRELTLISYHQNAKNAPLGVRHCLANGTWSSSDERLFCKDTESPQLDCPASIKKPADYGKATAVISWSFPTVVDNVDVISLTIREPLNIRKPPHAFRIGQTKVVYEATDSAGNSDTCSFTVTVLDNQPPKVDSCPSDIVVEHPDRTGKSIKWEEPQFSDNSGNVTLLSVNRKNGDLFHWGLPNLVTYEVKDPSGNKANCSFNVIVKAHSCQFADPPANGFLVCDKWTNGQLCSVSCKEGYGFTFEPESVYFCSQKTRKWTRAPGTHPEKKFIFPWPDCSRLRIPRGVNISISVNYTVTDCSSSNLTKVKEDFIQTLKRKHPHFCPTNKGCEVKNVDVTCKVPSLSSTSRHRRSLSNVKSLVSSIETQSHHKTRHRRTKLHRRSNKNSAILISFDIEVLDTDTSEECKNCSTNQDPGIFYDHGIDVRGSLEPSISESVSEVFKLEHSAKSNFAYNVAPLCDAGRIPQNNTCVNCPVGTFFNNLTSSCQVCLAGYYQDEEASLFCKICPEGTWSLKSKSKKVDDCKDSCKPGSFSPTGFEPCQACPQGTYQDLFLSTYCLPCPSPWSTPFTGASMSSHCVSACGVGSFSENGYFPCTQCPRGTYQPFSKQKKCLECPSGTTTLVEGAHEYNYCQTIHFCEDFKPCLNGANCTNLDHGYNCTCSPGFIGKNCDVNVDDCSPDSCEHNGTCVDEINAFSCICKPGFNGSRCELNIDDCQSGPCENGGLCSDLINGYSCECPEGFSGVNCEVFIDDCASNPCMNNGICFDMQNNFRCCCVEGYTGPSCNITVNKCDDRPCANGGTCIEYFNRYNCSCPVGFSGPHCEVNNDDCASELCANGGTCIDGIGNATCICPAYYFGERCENTIPSEFSIKYLSPVTNDYVLLHNTQHLFEVTVSFFMRTEHVSSDNRGTPVSYSYYNSETNSVVENALTLYDVNKFILYIHGMSIHTGYVANSDSKWHHYAITWESFNGSYVFYVDGKVHISGSDLAKGSHLYPGVFVLGQEQDSLGGTFSVLEAFVGELAEFNVWDYAFKPEEIVKLSKTCGFMGGVIPWYSTMEHLHGDLEVNVNVDLCTDIGICLPNQCGCRTNENSGLCKHAVDKCSPNPCANGQICIQNGTSSMCSCGTGYSGRLCEYYINECLHDNGHCSHTCTNAIGSYFCSCPENMVLQEDAHTCRDTSFCRIDDKMFLENEQWDDSCDICTCKGGNVTCEKKPCPKLSCKDGEERIQLPGHCCETCISQSSCIVYSNSTIQTFDVSEYQFHGNCQYTLVEDCVDGTFSLLFEQSNNTYQGKSLNFYIFCTKIAISPYGNITVNDIAITLPYEDDSVYISATKQSCNITNMGQIANDIQYYVNSTRNNSLTHSTVNTHKGNSCSNQSSELDASAYDIIKILTHNGVLVEWHYSENVIVSLTQEFMKKTCGMCGNFNGSPRDDYPNKTALSDRMISFFGSWKSNTNCNEESITKVSMSQLLSDNQLAIKDRAEVLTQRQPWITLNCHHLTDSFKQIANKACSVFWSNQFQQCNEVVNPNVYHILCLQDACSCTNGLFCFCNSVLAYITECATHNIILHNLGSAEVCRKHCTNGMVYQKCGPTCSDSCDSEVEEHCLQKWQCIPGCYCPEGTVLHKGHCILRSDCPNMSVNS